MDGQEIVLQQESHHCGGILSHSSLQDCFNSRNWKRQQMRYYLKEFKRFHNKRDWSKVVGA